MAKKKLYDENGNEVKAKLKKPFYTRWWFWLLVVVIGGSALSGGGEETGSPETAEVATSKVPETDTTEVTAEEVENSSSEENEAESSREIVLGQPMELGDYVITFQSYSLGVDYEGKNALIINYDWVNNSDDSTSPYITFTTKGFQDGVETSDVFMVDGVDLGIGQSEVKPGAQIQGAQDVVAIEDLAKPLELEVEELFSFKDNAFSTILDLTTLQE